MRVLRLGQSLEDVRDALSIESREVIAYDKQDGSKEMLIYPRFLPSSARGEFKGVDNARLWFMDERLVSIRIEYAFETKWDDVETFIRAVAANLKLPAEGWAGSGPARLQCEGFVVEAEVNVVGQAQLRLYKSDIFEESERRRREAEEKRRREFKP